MGNQSRYFFIQVAPHLSSRLHSKHIASKMNSDVVVIETGTSGSVAKNSDHLTTEVNLAEWQIRQLCLVTREIFLEQPMLLELEAPVNIVGDIHGQYEDLLRHFDKLGYPPDANYLFLGDYVDRGKNSLETICLLLAYKIKYPNNFFLLRGNHECASINRVYGFYDECKRRYSVKLWKTFTDLFNCLPVAALIEGTIFCMHGGLSPQLGELNDIRSIPRPIDVPDSGLVCDLLWGDPAEVGITHAHTRTHTHTHTHYSASCFLITC
uniref:Serine/threonine-protein phosphatase n=1 Tax=Timema shepardi TaxID=629360 RepID=A0A7R9FVE8_TIMSH|nr:unnamed protein product [Timema shepardi]